MNSSFQQKVLAATHTCIRPFARMLLRSGINYQQFAEIAKNAFVDEAARDHNDGEKSPMFLESPLRLGCLEKRLLGSEISAQIGSPAKRT